MSAFSAINLADLPPPEVIARLDFETIFAALKADLIARDPDLAPVLDLESEPATKVLQVWAYRELLLRAEIDDAGRGNMLAFANGANLEQLAAFFGVTRAVVQIADPSEAPPRPEILEDDERLRRRTQLALEGFTTAGSRGSYHFWGLGASPLVKDIGVLSPVPGQVQVTVLSSEGAGVADATLQATVLAALNDEDVRPLTDQVAVQSASIISYEVVASLVLFDGPDSSLVVAVAEQAVRSYVDAQHRLGFDVTVSGLHSALHQSGVQNVIMTSPAANIVVGETEAAHCGVVAISVSDASV
ncbi:baseplate J/gp47 family protein [Ascidiaceihabitans sp.]|uniref:baseplate assembly protein n=1 Tax=Ascidiaceihabitans sp. TaxID=1872644 RepID=UPI0032980103